MATTFTAAGRGGGATAPAEAVGAAFGTRASLGAEDGPESPFQVRAESCESDRSSTVTRADARTTLALPVFAAGIATVVVLPLFGAGSPSTSGAASAATPANDDCDPTPGLTAADVGALLDGSVRFATVPVGGAAAIVSPGRSAADAGAGEKFLTELGVSGVFAAAAGLASAGFAGPPVRSGRGGADVTDTCRSAAGGVAAAVLTPEPPADGLTFPADAAGSGVAGAALAGTAPAGTADLAGGEAAASGTGDVATVPPDEIASGVTVAIAALGRRCPARPR